MTDEQTLDLSVHAQRKKKSSAEPVLVLAWCAAEPWRSGEVLRLDASRGQPLWLGRGAGELRDTDRATFVRQRPGGVEVAPPISDRYLSRKQLKIELLDSGELSLENHGRCPLRIRGHRLDQGTLKLGEVATLESRMVLYFIERVAPAGEGLTAGPRHHFGGPDTSGIVGESPAAWAMRGQVALAAPRSRHVLVLGASGTGKELVAQAIHRGSARAQGPLVSRNAATIPEALMDAEVFGNAKSYPNPGMPERPGLLGEADGGTLFLDEIGDLSHGLQAHLLRVLDSGEYQRLGDATQRRADIRFVGATNRGRTSLKHDVQARLTIQLELPDLNQRREDIPQLIRHLLGRVRREDPDLAHRFFRAPEEGMEPEPVLATDLVRALMLHKYSENVRELDRMLWCSILASPASGLELVDELEELLKADEEVATVQPSEITAEAISASLERHDGVLSKVWKDLGLKDRYVLRRLMRKFEEQGWSFARGEASTAAE